MMPKDATLSDRSAWTTTDSKQFQYGLRVGEGCYRFREFNRSRFVRMYRELKRISADVQDSFIKDLWEDLDYWVDKTIELKKFSSKRREAAVSMFYPSVEDLQRKCPTNWEWILAELVFEYESGLYIV